MEMHTVIKNEEEHHGVEGESETNGEDELPENCRRLFNTWPDRVFS
jgi:hypothetical protein